MSDPDPEPPERQRAVVVLAIGLVVAVLLATAAIVLSRDLISGPDPDPTATTGPPASPTPEPTPWPNSPPPANRCQPASETPKGIQGQAAGRQLCRQYADRLRHGTDAMFECQIGDRIEDCRDAAAAAWATLMKLMAEPDYQEAKVLLDGAFDLAQVNGSHYLSADCKGRNAPDDEAAVDCTTSYSAFGVGLSSLEYLLRSM